MPGLPMSELVAIDNGKWDFARNVSPALAAALQEAPDEGPEGIASAVNELIQMLEQLNSQEGGESVGRNGRLAEAGMRRVCLPPPLLCGPDELALPVLPGVLPVPPRRRCVPR